MEKVVKKEDNKSLLDKRIDWIDISKGLGMILVILGHCVNKDTPIHNWIFSFHMPFFFFLSGYCYNRQKKGLKDTFISRSKRLLLPWVYFYLIGLIICLFISDWRKDITIAGVLVDLYTGYPKLSHITSTWFLISLFLCTMIWCFVNKYIHYERIKIILIVMSGVAGAIISIIHEVAETSKAISTSGGGVSSILPGGRLPLTIDATFTAFVFFAIGNTWKSYEKRYKIEKYENIIVAALLIAINVFVSVFLNSRVNIHGCMQGNIVYFYVAAFSGIAAITIISKLFAARNVYILELLGRHSLFVLGFQSLAINLYVEYINAVNNRTYSLYIDVPMYIGCVGFIIIFVVSVLVCRIFEEINGGHNELE